MLIYAVTIIVESFQNELKPLILYLLNHSVLSSQCLLIELLTVLCCERDHSIPLVFIDVDIGASDFDGVLSVGASLSLSEFVQN